MCILLYLNPRSTHNISRLLRSINNNFPVLSLPKFVGLHLKVNPIISFEESCCHRKRLEQKSPCLKTTNRCLQNINSLKVYSVLSNRNDTLSISNSSYLTFLESLVQEFNSIEEKTSICTKDEDRYLFLKSVTPFIKSVQEKNEELSELKKIISAEEDEEMKALLHKEESKTITQLCTLELDLIDSLTRVKLSDSNTVSLEVEPGVGGQEAMLFCRELFLMYYNYALSNNWEIVSTQETEADQGGYSYGMLEITGLNSYSLLRVEGGIHRVQRVPKTERSGRMHTSTASVTVVPKPKDIHIEIDRDDLKEEYFRSSGPGGQNANVTDSAVRLTHLPTGIAIECSEGRRATENRKTALKRLTERLFTINFEEEMSKYFSSRRLQMGSKGRSEKIRTYNFNQKRITDHRLKSNCSSVEDFMNGGTSLNEMIVALVEKEKRDVVEQMLQNFLSQNCNKS